MKCYYTHSIHNQFWKCARNVTDVSSYGLGHKWSGQCTPLNQHNVQNVCVVIKILNFFDSLIFNSPFWFFIIIWILLSTAICLNLVGVKWNKTFYMMSRREPALEWPVYYSNSDNDNVQHYRTSDVLLFYLFTGHVGSLLMSWNRCNISIWCIW